MFVNAKRMAFLGLLLACSVILVILSGILEFNTLFLLAAASFGIGIAIRECGLRLGSGFFIAASLLSFMLAPNKFYCITFTAMGFYVVLAETAWERLALINKIKNRMLLLWVIKFLVFNIIYIPILFFMPKLIYEGKLSTGIMIALLIGGQAILYIYDKAYNYFQKMIWGKVRTRFHM